MHHIRPQHACNVVAYLRKALDGGQILRSVLWYLVGPANSLIVATVIGFIGGCALFAYGLYNRSTWNMVLAGFLLFNCWKSFQYARQLRAHLRNMPPVPPAAFTTTDS